MPDVTLSSAKPTTVRADALVLGVRNDEDGDDFADTLALLNFTAKNGYVAKFPGGKHATAKLVIAVGLPAEPTAEDLRRAAARGIKAAKGAGTVAMALNPAGVDEVEAIAEGIHLGSYEFERYKTKKKEPNLKVTTTCLLYTSPSPRDRQKSRMPSS